MKISTITRIDLTLTEVRTALQAYNQDMMVELASTYFDIIHAGRAGSTFPLEAMAEFAEVIADPIRRAELAAKAGVEFVNTPTTAAGWRDLVVDCPQLFIDIELLDKEAAGLQITLEGVHLDVKKLLASI